MRLNPTHSAAPVEVNARRIEKVEGDILILEDGEAYLMELGMTARYLPTPGDYLVTQLLDGYVYLNPKAVFERKYSPIGAENAS